VYQEPPQRPLTARNLADYALCPQKFLLSFFVPKAQADRLIGGPAARHQAVRAALIECYREGGPPVVSSERLLELFEENWQGELCADSLEEEQLHTQGQEMLRRYHQDHAGEPARAIADDLRMEQEIGGHRFVAVADRIDEEADGSITLLRYKTARQVLSSRKLAKDLSAQVLLLVGERRFQQPAQVAIYALRPGKLIVAEFGTGERRQAELETIQQATRIRRARQYPTNRGRHCRVCRSRPQCPAWHPPPGGEEE